ncbi:MAG: hypothetical protein QOJ29_2947 [Thermoleophilaceae bacterium]|nr:hypothetical protein [Thermoleophilaceae bacterium]
MLGLLLAAVVIAVIGTRGGRDNQSGKPLGGATTTTSTTKQAPAGKAAPRSGRQRVRRGRGSQPDRPAPGTQALLAIADQKPATFADPAFRKLGVARSRLNTPWNAIFAEPGRLDAWLSGARNDGVEPLIAFERSRGDQCPAAPCNLPPLSAYTRAVSAFHKRYPWVRLIQPWNEANSATQPTGKDPERAAAYYEVVKRICSGCTIPAADVLDGSNLVRWIGRFRAALKGPSPQLWGLHNYSDTNRFHSDGTKRLLGLVPGEVWFTEAGGIVSFKTADGRTALAYDEKRAARAIRYLFRLARLSSRITRIYIYQWKIDFPGNRFDAGLVGLDGRPRPALGVVLQHRALLR